VCGREQRHPKVKLCGKGERKGGGDEKAETLSKKKGSKDVTNPPEKGREKKGPAVLG